MELWKKLSTLSVFGMLSSFALAINFTALTETVSGFLTLVTTVIDALPGIILGLAEVLITLGFVSFILGLLAVILGLINIKSVAGMFKK